MHTNILQVILFIVLWIPTTAFATTYPNTCTSGGRGQACVNSYNCEDNPFATVCVDGRCQIPCGDQITGWQPNTCALGETCISGLSDQEALYYCEPAVFSVDLNILDMSIAHFINGIIPDLTSGNECSLEANLNQLLDVDRDGLFTVFDIDGTIRAFFNQPSCSDSETCTNGLIYCDSNTDCGEGSYCDTDVHHCVRECGFIANRELHGTEYLERKCYGNLKTCDYSLGKCKQIDIDNLTCQIDRDCPSGSYCFLGYCEAQCNRSIDCIDNNWYCSQNGQCLPIPSPDANDDFQFDPRDYTIHFQDESIELSEIDNSAILNLDIMSLLTKEEVQDNPAIVFGYRLEITYAHKLDSICHDLSDASSEVILDCIITPEEEYLTIDKPYGTIFSNNASISVSLNQINTSKLSSGFYTATLKAFFNNGSIASIPINFKKSSLSGHYFGKIIINTENPDQLFGTANLSMNLSINKEQNKTWYQILVENNLDTETDFVDLSSGYEIKGFLDCNESIIFNNPHATSNQQNKLPVKGLYNSESKQVHLISVIDIDAQHCISDDGNCSDSHVSLEETNIFNRPIRRTIHFVGTLDPLNNSITGSMRDVFYNLFVKTASTLQGTFYLIQESDTNEIIEISEPLVTSSNFLTSSQTINEQIDYEVSLYCSLEDFNLEALYFQNRDNFEYYLNDFESNRIFSSITVFEDSIRNAVNSVTSATGQLTVFDYLRDKLTFCSEDSELNCIEDDKVLCGLALYKKAIYNDWLPLLDASTDNLALLCNASNQSPSCTMQYSQNQNYVLRRELMTFYLELAQTTKYSASAALSDAFMLLYRDHGDEFLESEGLLYKEESLHTALSYYNNLRKQLLESSMAVVLQKWPMNIYTLEGQDLLDQIHSILFDRIDVLTTLVDLKRRIYNEDTNQDFIYIQKLLHQEYITHVFLYLLQKQWQRGDYRYEGKAQELIDTGNLLSQKVSTSRNPLGFHPNQVFFENSNLQLKNWENYKSLILQGVNGNDGLLSETTSLISTARSNLEASLNNFTDFEQSISESQSTYADRIAQLCGPEEDIPESACETEAYQYLNIGAATIQLANTTTENSSFTSFSNSEYQDTQTVCTADFSNSCDTTISVGLHFDFNKNDISNPACKIGIGTFFIPKTKDDKTLYEMRPCYRGEVGALLQERETLRLQKKQVQKKMDLLGDESERLSSNISVSYQAHKDILDVIGDYYDNIRQSEKTIFWSQKEYEQAAIVAQALENTNLWDSISGKTFISAGGYAAQSAALWLTADVQNDEQNAIYRLQKNRELKLQIYNFEESMRQKIMQLDNLTTQYENYVIEDDLLTRQLFNLNIRIQDTFHLAQIAAQRHIERTDNIFEKIIGTEHNELLMGYHTVSYAQTKFDQLLRLTYKMVMAFIHQYNLHDRKQELLSKVFHIVTPQGIAELVDELELYKIEYCGDQAIDCDNDNNSSYLKFSLRENLFPELQDIVDPTTGTVITKGQQFHNLITSSQFLHKRKRGLQLIRQIEIPFSIWLQERGISAFETSTWMVSPLECNHLITGKNNGTIGVNVIGTRLLDTITFELKRGGTDNIRSCTAQQSTDGEFDYPIYSYTIGYAPQSDLAAQQNPPSFKLQTAGITACKNQHENTQEYVDNESCYFWFARDRSLAAPDWQFIIPLDGSGYENEWLMGDNMRDDEKPIIEDIVLYMRYHRRPINEM